MADPVPPHATTNTASTSSPPPTARPSTVYHANPKIRINDILETARRRSVTLAESSQPVSMSASPRLSPRQTSRLSSHDENVGDTQESSADERTAIVRRENGGRNDYQSTSTSLRSQNSQSAIRRSTQGRRSNEASGHPEPDGNQSWWRKQVEKFGSIELENKGSVARDHLALERTFLAWLRTSLAFASIGIAITQLFRLNTSISNNSTDGAGDDPFLHLRQLGKPLGATFLGISILVLFVGFHRYFESQHWIIRGKFPASRGSVAFIAAIAFALMLASLIVVLVVEPTAFEKRR